MNRPLGLLIRLLVLFSLVMASLPSGAVETVCVVDGGKKVLPVAKCGMSCCTKLAPKPAAVTREKCCAAKKEAPSVDSRSQDALCRMATMDCRCETQLIAVPIQVVAVSDKATVAPKFEHVALLPLVQPEVASRALLVAEPGVVGIDSGPPRRRPRGPIKSRAPPVSV